VLALFDPLAGPRPLIEQFVIIRRLAGKRRPFVLRFQCCDQPLTRLMHLLN